MSAVRGLLDMKTSEMIHPFFFKLAALVAIEIISCALLSSYGSEADACSVAPNKRRWRRTTSQQLLVCFNIGFTASEIHVASKICIFKSYFAMHIRSHEFGIYLKWIFKLFFPF